VEVSTLKISKSVTVLSSKGLNVRAAIQLHNLAHEFESEISIVKESLTANVKSLISLLALCSPQDTQMEITADGDDAKTAMLVITNYFNEKFGEKE
jgi:phosphotransferase system HPr (HPr) family protein